MNRLPAGLAILGLVVVLGAANYTIWQRQQVVDNGQPVLLRLRPVDPRSLMQGDYMQLAYAEDLFPPSDRRGDMQHRGALVIVTDRNNVATFSRFDDGSPLAENERLLKYKQVDDSGQIRLGAESIFFEEGQAELFSAGRYGVLHTDPAGNSVLVGLADDKWQLIQAGAN